MEVRSLSTLAASRFPSVIKRPSISALPLSMMKFPEDKDAQRKLAGDITGCYACHDIHGFETAKPIGTELSEWGSKPVDKLDFGLVDIEKARLSWLKQKLHAPRSFDNGRIDVTRMPQELLKMPKFAGAMATPHGMLRLPPVTRRLMNLPVVSKTLTIPLPMPPTGVKGAVAERTA